MNKRYSLLLSFLTIFSLVGSSCSSDNKTPESLRQAQKSPGPTIVFDLDQRPFPEIPFPNNLATINDPSSPTGLRINISFQGTSAAEDDVRKAVNQQPGFGLLSPIWVAFDQPLDVDNIAARHHETPPSFEDDVVFLVNVDKRSKNYGQLVHLDMGRGNYPILAAKPDPINEFPNTPNPNWNNLLFENNKEVDLNHNGVLDWEEDIDDDGVLDAPNVFDDSVDPSAPGNMIDFYEKETNTLIMRPIMPLEPKTTYAIVLSSELKGINGSPINSPFDVINHTRQTKELEPLRTILPEKLPNRFSSSLENVRFAWSFTTGYPQQGIQLIREGLYGSGPFKWLSEKYPPEMDVVFNPNGPNSSEPMIFRLEPLIDTFSTLIQAQLGQADGLIEQFKDIDYIVLGSFRSPYFLADDDGDADEGLRAFQPNANPADLDEHFRINYETGEAFEKENEVTFVCTVPKEKNGRKAPFPTMVYSHAISSTRFENLVFASAFAKFGIAACTIDSVGHGIAANETFDLTPSLISTAKDIIASKANPSFAEIVFRDRARDVDNDGYKDAAPDYFTSDLLHSRDNIRQTTIDQMNLIRILRTFDGVKRFPEPISKDDPRYLINPDLISNFDANGDGVRELAGDFNGDGVVDFGGPSTAFTSFGTSLGGLQTALLAGHDPVIKAAATNAGGGILGDIASRTIISNVRNGAIIRIFGPLLVGDVDSNKNMTLRWVLGSNNKLVDVPFAKIDNIEDGDQIVLTNETLRQTRPHIPEHDHSSYAYVRNGKVQLTVVADALDGPTRRARLQFDPTIHLGTDILGCSTGEYCGGQSCDSRSSCINDQCVPVGECFASKTINDVDPELHDELNKRTVNDPTQFGDHLVLEVYRRNGPNLTIDTFQQNAVFENIFYPKGAPLAALTQGWGQKQQTPRFRKFIAIAQMLLEVSDPAIAMKHARIDPITYPYEEDFFKSGFTRLLITGTIGDRIVPIATQLALGRTAGLIDFQNVRDDLKTTENQFLIQNYVYEGLAKQNRFPAYPNTLFDPDNLDQGLFRSSSDPSNPNPNPDADPPLRATTSEKDGSISALRLAYLKTQGEHTYNVPTSTPFKVETYMTNMVGWYLSNWGRKLSDDTCLQDTHMKNCSFYDNDSYTAPAFK